MNESPPATKPKRPLHILCIDDDEQILEMMKACLAQFGHEVRVASGGMNGIEMFCTAILKSEPFNVVITDLGMPYMNGYQVARMIKAESPSTRIIVLTGDGPMKKEAGEGGSTVDAVLSKPPRFQELNELLHRLAG